MLFKLDELQTRHLLVGLVERSVKAERDFLAASVHGKEGAVFVADAHAERAVVHELFSEHRLSIRDSPREWDRKIGSREPHA